MEHRMIPLEQLVEAPFNPNHMDGAMECRLRLSLEQFGMVQNLVARPAGNGEYEVLSGNQRLRILRDQDIYDVPCAVVEANDVEARILVQALNRIQGDDDIGLKADLLQTVLESVSADELLTVLPESAKSLAALMSLGTMDMGEHLEIWDKAQAAKLKRMTFQLSKDQVAVVEEAMERSISNFDRYSGRHSGDSSPHQRGYVLYELCHSYLESGRDLP